MGELILFVSVLALAFVVRIYHIGSRAEFLGDQGRTGITIYTSFLTRSLPLAGPPVLTGQHLGPIWYYLIGPAFVLSRFNPLGPSIFMAIAGVGAIALLYILLKKIFGVSIATIVSLLYAFSPTIVRSDQTIWEPNLVPLFVTLFLLGIYVTCRERRLGGFVLVAISTGVLIQLHYPNIIFLPLAGIVALYILSRKQSVGSKTKILLWILLGFTSFCIIQFPFLVYERMHNFQDLREIALVMLTQQHVQLSFASTAASMIEFSSRLFFRVIPIGSLPLNIVLQMSALIAVLSTLNSWNIFLLCWYIVGIFAMSQFSGTVFDHYLFFLLPLPFLFIGVLLKRLGEIRPRLLLPLGIFLIIWQVTQPDILARGSDDISRTSRIAGKILSLAQDEPYSFTLIQSKSFSDLHYRYYFLLSGHEPRPIGAGDYRRLFIICESPPCQNERELQETAVIPVLCFDPHCQGPYPEINLGQWKFERATDVSDSRIYEFTRL